MQMGKAIEVLRRERTIKLAYLFGSATRGEVGKLSDIDVGIFIDESLPSNKRFKLQLELTSKLAQAMKTDKVDLIVMNEAPLLLNYNIIKHGRPVKFDLKSKVRFEASILSKYLDRKYSIERHTSLGIKRIAEKGFS